MTEWTEAKVLALLEARYPGTQGQWAFFTHLRGHTGHAHPGRESYMDAFAINCWPSKNYVRHALEVKVSRSDFLREMRDPGKRQRAMELANEFWFVAPSGVIKKGECPEGCGWLELTKGGFRVRRSAKFREVDDLPMTFVASLLRHASTPGRLTPAQLRVFHFAGRELTVKEFLAESDQAVQTSARSLARTMLRDMRDELPEMRLARAVRKAMGVGYYSTPRPEDFCAWLAAMTGFSGGTPVEPLAELKDHLRKGWSRFLDVEAALTGRRR